MAPREGEEAPSSFPGLSKYPTDRDKPFRLAEDWIEGEI